MAVSLIESGRCDLTRAIVQMPDFKEEYFTKYPKFNWGKYKMLFRTTKGYDTDYCEDCENYCDGPMVYNIPCGHKYHLRHRQLLGNGIEVCCLCNSGVYLRVYDLSYKDDFKLNRSIDIMRCQPLLEKLSSYVLETTYKFNKEAQEILKTRGKDCGVEPIDAKTILSPTLKDLCKQLRM